MRKILVVDDDSIVLDSCQRVLADEGFEVSLAYNADGALKTMEGEDFALLLIDVKMPKRDGLYLMGEIKKKWPKTPIIAMSGYPTPETIADGVRMGAAKFIPKPFTPDELLRSVCQVLEPNRKVR